MKNERYSTYTITPIPTDKFPDMVLVTKGNKVSKKFVNITKAKIWIDTKRSNALIQKGSKNVKNELLSIGIIPDEL